MIQVDDPAAFPLAFQGPLLEHHEWFPQRANIEVWRPLADGSVEMRVWERGVGETPACGTGACAVAVSAVLDGLAHSPVTVRLPGGSLEVAVGARPRDPHDGSGRAARGARRCEVRAPARPGARVPDGAAQPPDRGAPRGRPRRDLARRRRSRPAAERGRARGAGARRAARRRGALPDQPRPARAARGGGALLRHAVRRRRSTRRPRWCRCSAPRRGSRTSRWRSSTPATSRSWPIPATRSTSAGRCWRAPSRTACRCCRSSASSPTSAPCRPACATAPTC